MASADVKTPRSQAKTSGKSTTPPTNYGFTEEEKLEREQAFSLDCVAVGNFTQDSQNYNPKHAIGIPPYNPRSDKHSANYFKTSAVKATLKKTGQWSDGGDSINGKNVDNLCKDSALEAYVTERNQHGPGHSELVAGGHQSYLSDAKPIIGYHGNGGYRRNTPSLRNQPDILGGRIVSGR